MKGAFSEDKEPPPAALGRAEQAAVELAATKRAGSGWEGEPDALSTPNGSCVQVQPQRNGNRPLLQRRQVMSAAPHGNWNTVADRSMCRHIPRRMARR